MKKEKKKNANKKKSSWAKKLALGLFLLALISVIAAFVINAYIKSSVAGRIISKDEAATLGADCIVILGAGVKNDGTPSHMLEDRLLRGLEVYGTGAAKKILVSGDHGREEYDEVNTMKDFLIARGVASSDIFMDHAGFSTYETMYRAKEVFGAEKIIVITQGYHLYRALYIADALGLDACGVSSDLRTYVRQEYFSFREAIARVKDFFTVMTRPEPTYLGESIPISGDGDITNDKKGGAA